MRYITGIWALNLPSPDGTPGDWHFSALNWQKAVPVESKASTFGEWGLHTAEVPFHGEMSVANHIRACLDLIEQGSFGTAQGMRRDFIVNDKLNPLIFSKVALLRDSKQWKDIDAFMGKEYLCQWLDFKKERRL